MILQIEAYLLHFANIVFSSAWRQDPYQQKDYETVMAQITVSIFSNKEFFLLRYVHLFSHVITCLVDYSIT